MRIFVISDTHGNTSRVYEVYGKLLEQGPIDLIIHCGDYYIDALQIEDRTGIPVTKVKGNSDDSYDETQYAIVPTEYGNLLVTHGHMEMVSFTQQNLYYKALDLDCRAAIYGHTHQALFTEAGGVYLFNPGSLTQPRDGSSGTFGLILTSPDQFQANLYEYDSFFAENPSKNLSEKPSKTVSKKQGGFLRNLFNYSDRF